MPTPHITSIQDANRIFVAASKRGNPKPTPAQRKAVVTRLVREVRHPPRNLEAKKSLLVRVGKYLKLPAYRAYLMAALVASGGVATIGIGAATIAKNPTARSYADTLNKWIPKRWMPPSKTKATTEYMDMAFYIAALQGIFGAAVGGHVLKQLASTFSQRRDATGN